MKTPEEKCTAQAKVTLAWGGKLLNYCPVHANQIVVLSNAMGAPVQAQPMPPMAIIICGSSTPLTEEERKLNETFPF